MKAIWSVFFFLFLFQLSAVAQDDLFDEALSEEDLFAEPAKSEDEGPSEKEKEKSAPKKTDRVISSDDSGSDEFLDEDDLFGDMNEPVSDSSTSSEQQAQEAAPEQAAPAPSPEVVEESQPQSEEYSVEETSTESTSALDSSSPSESVGSRESKNGGFVYTVQKGDTLSEIAEVHMWYPIYGGIEGSLTVLASCNGIQNKDFIMASSKIYIPANSYDSSCPQGGYVDSDNGFKSTLEVYTHAAESSDASGPATFDQPTAQKTSIVSTCGPREWVGRQREASFQAVEVSLV